MFHRTFPRIIHGPGNVNRVFSVGFCSTAVHTWTRNDWRHRHAPCPLDQGELWEMMIDMESGVNVLVLDP